MSQAQIAEAESAARPPGPVVHLERPSARRQREFLAGVKRSARLHRHSASPPRDAASFRAWLARLRSPTCEGHFVVRTHDAALAGVVNLNEIVRGSFQSAYLGYFGFVPYAGKGLLGAGLRLVIGRAFGELGLHRLEANIQPENRASLALVARLGFRREGFSPRYLKIAGRWRDHERWALLREDWTPSAASRTRLRSGASSRGQRRAWRRRA